jgi:deoxyribodipyrimidine photo-lyase
MENKEIAIHWFRRDLRLEDNAALYHALRSGYPVLPVFIFDRHILDRLGNPGDHRVLFIHKRLGEIAAQLRKRGVPLEVHYGTPEEIWPLLLQRYRIAAVYTNHDYEPYARQRDAAVANLLEAQGTRFLTFKDQVIFEKDEVLKDDGKPYTVYTPYSRKWMAKLNDDSFRPYPCDQHYDAFLKADAHPMPGLEEMGFRADVFSYPPAALNENTVRDYAAQRDIPGVDGTTRLGLHLRFGTLSIRQLARKAKDLSFAWLNELCWREFYMMIIWHFPHVVNKAFKPAYDHIPWRNNEEEFAAWCQGRTGYPIVDAGMRELVQTGYMHNRVRMITASFLTKHLLIDWRWGEAFFARHLLDFELSSNNGGWQWAAGSGCDAAPYFRVFNPYEQTRKFDPKFTYIRKWVPEFEDFGYPQPIVEHKFARERCLSVYKTALGQTG